MKQILALAFLLLGCAPLSAQNSTFPNPGPEAFETIIKTHDGIQVVDVRTREEFEEGHLAGSILIDYKMDAFLDICFKVLDRNTPVALYCKGGVRGRGAAEKLLQAGFSQVYNLDKGYTSWKEAGKPVTLGR